MESSPSPGSGAGVARGLTSEPKAVPLSPLFAAVWLERLKRPAVTGPVLMLLISCAFCWKLALSNEYTWVDTADMVRMDAPRLQFQRAAWQHHEFPLWDPYLWCGQPFLGEITGAAFPLNWPLFLLPLHGQDPLTLGLLNWYWVYLHFLAALFAYWLCRDLQCSQIASLFGGVVFAFAGFLMIMRWPEVLSGVLMAPLVLLFLLRARRGRHPWSSAALSGMFLGLAWLSGHHEVPIYLSFTVAAVWVYDLFSRSGARLRFAALAATSVGIAILTSGFQTLPGYEYAKLAVRWTGADHPQTWRETIPYEVHTQYSMTPSSLVGLVLPWSGGNTEAFIGFVALALVVLAVWIRWHEPVVRVLAAIALAGYLLALGGWNLFHGVFYAALPLFGKARSPSRLLAIFLLGVAPLAAVGLDAFRTHGRSQVLRIIGRILLAFGGAVWALGLASVGLHIAGPSDYLYLAALIIILAGALLLGLQQGAVSSPFAMLAAFALASIELASLSAGVYRERNPGQRPTVLPELTEYHAAANFLRTQPGPLRVDVSEVTGQFNFGDWENLETLNGFGAGLTRNLEQFGWSDAPVKNLLGVNYSFSKHDPRPDQQLVFRDRGGFNIYKNLNAFPRAWIVHEAQRLPSVDVVNAWLFNPAFDARRTVLLLDKPPALQACSETSPVRMNWRTANTVDLTAQPACRGMLILADTWYPGWRAIVDGRNSPIYQAYSAVRGVVLEPGLHHIQFRYNPGSAWIGGAMSIFGILAACALTLWERRHARAKESSPPIGYQQR